MFPRFAASGGQKKIESLFKKIVRKQKKLPFISTLKLNYLWYFIYYLLCLSTRCFLRADRLPGNSFDVTICRKKLAEHYKRTATVPTSVWSKNDTLDIHAIYTRLSLVKVKQTPAGKSQPELNHYTDVFTETKNGLPSNRILVQGQTGIGKSMFVKKLAMDWAELDEKRLTDEQRTILKKFELAVIIDLTKVSKYQNLRDIISASNIFADEDTAMTDDLLRYITRNQEKVLLVFDGYDEYCFGSNSEIFEIFKRNKLRNCCVLITTRISRADELKQYRDLHAEITGFSEEDRNSFMITMLGGKTQAIALWDHLNERKLDDLARVPLLLLFFCTLWKKEKLQSFPDSKAKLYFAIVQCVLDHNEGKCSPTNFREVKDFKDVLAKIGKVALECLLKNDHVFEYNQLSAVILCEKSQIIGLFQLSEYTENVRPAKMVSFIHKSIQEFLAAWYITNQCVTQGNLGEINDRARTLDKCRSLENVFQFICGLSDDGAVKVFEHLRSVRISDPNLDLSKTMPYEQSETDVTLCDVTVEQRSFLHLVYDSFDEVESKTELFKHCLNCTDGIILLLKYVRSIFDFVPRRKILNEVLVRGVVWDDYWWSWKMTELCESLQFLNCLDIPLKTSENSAAVSVFEFLSKFEAVRCDNCTFCCILHFHRGQSLFYFTELSLRCDDHARLFTENFTQSPSTSLCFEPSSLKFLRSLQIGLHVNEHIVRCFSTIIRDCKNFESIGLKALNESALECLEQIPNPLTCRLKLGITLRVKSSEILKLAGLLPRFNNLITCSIELDNSCCSEAENKLFSSITHKTIVKLELWNIRLTSATAAALGRSLPEMSSLKRLSLKGRNSSTVQEKEIKALFGGLNKIFPALKILKLSSFSCRGCLAPLIGRLHFFPNLWFVELSYSNLGKGDLRGLLDGLRSIPDLMRLWLQGNPLGEEDRVKSIVKQALPQVEFLYHK